MAEWILADRTSARITHHHPISLHTTLLAYRHNHHHHLSLSPFPLCVCVLLYTRSVKNSHLFFSVAGMQRTETTVS